MTGWRLYYGDGSTFSSSDGSWSDAPTDNVQVLAVYDESPYKVLTDGEDTYRLDGEPDVKHGRWVGTDRFYAIQAEAMRSEAP